MLKTKGQPPKSAISHKNRHLKGVGGYILVKAWMHKFLNGTSGRFAPANVTSKKVTKIIKAKQKSRDEVSTYALLPRCRAHRADYGVLDLG
jgi:hypothetical protein